MEEGENQNLYRGEVQRGRTMSSTDVVFTITARMRTTTASSAVHQQDNFLRTRAETDCSTAASHGGGDESSDISSSFVDDEGGVVPSWSSTTSLSEEQPKGKTENKCLEQNK
ncbi:unnamed protein product [Amoebophrya sp. A120]|nr:unnamed protein product [Amoebophrya sp. A120]|eukprot:GSA120T00008411001.1